MLKKLNLIAIVLVLVIAGATLLYYTMNNSNGNSDNEKTEIVVWGLFDESDVYRGMIEEYQSQNRDVEIKYYKLGNKVDEYEDLVISEIAEGEGPDVFLVKNTWLDKHMGKITPLNENEYISPKVLREEFVPTVASDFVVDEKVYGVPLYVDNLAIFYNQSVFIRDVPSRGKPGKTWDDIKEDVIKITKTDNSPERFEVAGIALGRADNISRFGEIITLMMKQRGVRFYNQAGTGSVIAGVQSEDGSRPGAEALRFYTSFANPNYGNFSWNDAITRDDSAKEIAAFAKGKVAMIIGYSYYYENIMDKIEEMKKADKETMRPSDVAVAYLPQDSEDADKINYANYFAYTVSKNSKNPEIAWDFIGFMTEDERLSEYHNLTHKPTSKIGLIDNQATDAVYGIFSVQANHAVTFDLIDEEFFFTEIKKAVENINSGRTMIEEALREVEEAVSAKMQQEREINNLTVN